MSTFSNSEIEEAKRRVREMQSRADSYISGGKSAEKEENRKPPRENDLKRDLQKSSEAKTPVKREEASQDDSFIMILLLIIILSHEGADNKLLLALLYLLL